ncbi:regulator of chromosome condensation 1/beta-lactamase-inhibitor protein II [Pelagophyceae sp. CCMP2097]|nr:regulator of chromosome condensation 1/beta-lactamase-inhibitor protein II [Pelagophyceae sp. CCMP2097]
MNRDERAHRRTARAAQRDDAEPRAPAAAAPASKRRVRPAPRRRHSLFWDVIENTSLSCEVATMADATAIAAFAATSKRCYGAWLCTAATFAKRNHGVDVAWGPEDTENAMRPRAPDSDVETPLELLRFFEVRDDATSRRGASFAAFSARHSIFVENGFAYACGRADDGRCGLPVEALERCEAGGAGALLSPTPLRLDTRAAFKAAAVAPRAAMPRAAKRGAPRSALQLKGARAAHDEDESEADSDASPRHQRPRGASAGKGRAAGVPLSASAAGGRTPRAAYAAGADARPATLPRPVALALEARVQACAAGAGHTIVLSGLGVASCCGRGAPVARSAPRSARRDEIASVPRALFLVRMRVVFASASANHALFVTAGGLALSSGVGAFGRLGHGDEADGASPRVIEALRDERVIAAAAGAAHSLFATARGDAYACGQGEDGRLGLGPPSAADDDDDGGDGAGAGRAERRMRLRSSGASDAAVGLPRGRTADRAGDVLRPRRVNPACFSAYGTLGADVLEVVAGAHHSVFVTRNGRAFSCGHNAHGQLGHARQRSFAPELVSLSVPSNASAPRALSDERRVMRCAAGYAHTLLVTKSGIVYACGSNAKGELGLGGLDVVVRPARTPPHNSAAALALGPVAHVAAGGSSSAFRSVDDRVFVCGANGDGQLGLGHYDDVRKLTRLETASWAT